MSPGATVTGEVRVPGDKSIAHRWLLFAASAKGRSRLGGLPRALDTISTASCLASLVPTARPALKAWAASPGVTADPHGSTWNGGDSTLDLEVLDLHGEGRGSLHESGHVLDCGNSGTTMRLVAGLAASAPIETTLRGDPSLSARPMERVAVPLRAMGADVATEDGHPPLTIRGGALRGIRFEPETSSAQVKGAVLIAGLAAEGGTSVVERVPTRDHTERLLLALGAPVHLDGSSIALDGPFQHGGLRGRVPGDPSSAAFLLGAAALTGGELIVRDVGLNPSRLRFLEVLARMGITVETRAEREELGEPMGAMRVTSDRPPRPVRVDASELPLVIDEVPLLAALAVHAEGESRFEGAGELRVKESDRLAALVEGIRALGGSAAEDRDTLVLGGGGMTGGSARPPGDHRIVMALIVAALAASGASEIDRARSAAVSFPGFVPLLRILGGRVEGLG